LVAFECVVVHVWVVLCVLGLCVCTHSRTQRPAGSVHPVASCNTHGDGCAPQPSRHAPHAGAQVHCVVRSAHVVCAHILQLAPRQVAAAQKERCCDENVRNRALGGHHSQDESQTAPGVKLKPLDALTPPFIKSQSPPSWVAVKHHLLADRCAKPCSPEPGSRQKC
jgi:hypothetical protein